jgi:hypothetical protein
MLINLYHTTHNHLRGHVHEQKRHSVKVAFSEGRALAKRTPTFVVVQASPHPD